MNSKLALLYAETHRAYKRFAEEGERASPAYAAAFNAQMREIKEQGKEAEDEYKSWVAERIGQTISL